MIPHPPLSLLVVWPASSSVLTPLAVYLLSLPHVRLVETPTLPSDLSPFDVVVTLAATAAADSRHMAAFVRNGGGWLVWVDGSSEPLPALLGVSSQPPGPEAELRVLFERSDHPLGVRLPDAIYVTGHYQALVPSDAATETILYADWHYDHTPVLTLRPLQRGQVACTTLQATEHPVVQQICYRLLRCLAGQPILPKPLGVGILGYAPSVGQLHGQGLGHTDGLALDAVCDLNPDRCDQAGRDFPDTRIVSSADALADTDGIDLVIVATPPNIHADNCLTLLAAGKHVVCEKPLALNQRETDRLQAAAEANRVHLSCHQNRRWDPDYLVIRDSLARGLIGELFYLETFVGGYHHPCGYWHSHAPVSGGTAYDWGAHYLDWIVSLIPQPVKAVIGTRHKRVWKDVSNADQERIQIRFEGGIEAEFLHSDVAAARKPKWHLLDTKGAITSRWRDVETHAIDPIHYYRRQTIPATEMPPALTLWQRRSEGEIVRIEPALPEREPYAFHRNLADHLLLGEPIAAPLADSIKVVAILETAARSMHRGGTVEVLDGR